jgi:hypothetical protein
MNVRNAILWAAALCALSLASVPAARAQVPYNEGPVERTVLLHITPGHAPALYADFKTNILPLWEAEKSAGLIVDYHIFLNMTTSGPDDWDLGYSIVYKDMAALDGLADKVYPLRMKQYGGSDAEKQVISKRVENAHIVVSNLSRDITLR